MKIFSDIIKGYSNTIGDRNEVDEVLTLPLFIQAILGQNILDPTWNWRARIWKQILITLLIIYVIFGTKDYLETATDLTAIGEAYFTFLITTIFSTKYLMFVNNRGTFRTLYLIAKTTVWDMLKEDSIVKSNDFLKTIKIVVKLIFVSVFFPILAYLLAAIWNNITGPTRVTLSKTTSILMPMTSPYYEIGLILHLIYLFLMAFSIMVIDLWFVLIMFLFCKASDCLVLMLKVEPKRHDESHSEYATRLNDGLRRFYKNHAKLMEYLNILSAMYKWPAVIPMLSVLIKFCLIMFLMSGQVKWAFLSNVLPTIVEIFTYNWFGEQVKNKAVELNMALLEFDWTSMRNIDKKSYLIIISYMTKDFSIKTALGNDLSLFTMSSICKASYQAYAVLKTMET